MSDQDFNIKVVTTADTSGIRQTSDELKRLRQESLRSALSPVPEGLGGSAAAKISPKIYPVIQDVPEEEARGFGDRFAGRISHGLTRVIAHALGIGAILEFVHGLKDASAEISKVAAALDKQGEELVKHAQLYGEEARHAKDQSDILKVSSATLKDIESTQKTVSDLAAKEVNWAAKTSDYLQTQLLARQRAAGVGDYEAARQAELQTAQDQALAARQRGMQEVLAAEKALNQTTEEHLATLNREIAAEEKRKATAAANTDPGGYVKAANNLAVLKKELQEFIKLEEQERQAKEKQQEAAYGAASPQAKAILENEKRARETGDQAFQKTADQLRKSATPADLAAVQAVIDTYVKAGRPGRTAGVGESQDLVDQSEKNRKAFEDYNKQNAGQGPDPLQAGAGKIGPAAQAERESAILDTLKESQAAMKDRLEELISLNREQIGIWR